MPKQNFTVDDILDEYSGDSKNESQKEKKKAETGYSGYGSFVNTGYIKIPPEEKNLSEQTIQFKRADFRTVDPHEAKPPRMPNLPQSRQAGKFRVADVERPNVSYINSVREVRRKKADLPPRATDKIEGYDGAVVKNRTSDDEYVPRIRRMSDSTRAKEMKSKRKRSKKIQTDVSYSKESPEGVYIKPQKKKVKFVIQHDDEEVKNKNAMVDLSNVSDPVQLDVDIVGVKDPIDEEFFREDEHSDKKKEEFHTSNKKHNIKDYDSFEDAKAIKRDIVELKGMVVLRIIILLILGLFSAYLTFAETLPIPIPGLFSPEKSPASYACVQLIFGIMSLLCSLETVRSGIVKLFKFKADCDSISSLAIISSVISGVFVLINPSLLKSGAVHVYISIAIASLLFNTVGKYLILNRAYMNFEFVSKDFDRHAIVCVEDDTKAESLTRGTIGDFPILAAMKRANFLKDFSKYTYSIDTGDRLCRVISPLVFAVSLLAAIVGVIMKGASFDKNILCYGFAVFAMCVSACSCMATAFIANIPLEKAAKRFVRNHGVMLGYQSVEDFYDTNSVMVDVDRLFPAGTINLASIKLFSDNKIDEVIVEAASLASHAGSALKDLFNDVIVGQKKILHRVENFVYEDSMGLCGWINNRRILLGNRDLMLSHNIEGIPTRTKEQQYTEGGRDALYLSVSGNLAAMFLIDIHASQAVKKSLAEMSKHDMALILKSVDPFITINRLSELFNYPEELIKIVPPNMVKMFDLETKKARKISASMACSGKFSSFIQLILGTKSIKQTVSICAVLQTASAILGFGIVALHCLLGAFSDVTASMLLLFNLAWTAVTAIVASVRKI